MALPTALVYAVSPVRTARLGTGAQSRLAADCSGFAASLWCACPFIYTETPPDYCRRGLGLPGLAAFSSDFNNRRSQLRPVCF